jgi:cobalt-zinc-cadmium efflux system outer membrane protein
MRTITAYIFLIIVTHSLAFSQKNLSLDDCESIFRQNNLLLLAEQYNIKIANANVIQAKIWELPVVSVELNAINPQDNRVFDIGEQGQKSFAIQQLIYLGKKKKKEVDFAKSTISIAELQFEQLLRNLRYQLHYSFYTIYFEQQKVKGIETQIANIDTLIKAYSVQAQKRNISMKDVVRLQSISIDLKNNLISFQKNIYQEQENLKILTGLSECINPIIEDFSFLNLYSQKLVPETEFLLKTSLEINPEYLSFLKIIDSQELMLKWQKSLATPDITAGISYDQRGGAFGNQINLTLGIPIPLWNRNKGNIQVSEAQIAQSKLLKDQKKLELESQIANAYKTWHLQKDQYNQIGLTINENFNEVLEGVLKNFKRQNITILEFTDFMESYNLSILQLNEMKKQLILSSESLNHIVNTNLF